jgi:hypothetical protein
MLVWECDQIFQAYRQITITRLALATRHEPNKNLTESRNEEPTKQKVG